MKPLISIIIPAYNEEGRIAKTLKVINQYFQKRGDCYEIIVVDDGSRDATRTVVENLNIPSIKLVSYDGNHGKGYAVNFGVKQSRGQWVLFADADNSTPIDQFDTLWQQTDSFQVVIGSRYLKESRIAIRQGVPRIIMGRLGNALIRLLVLSGINDTQCGFKLFSRRAADEIFALQTIWRWGFDIEILRIAVEHGYKIKEVPITWLNDEQSRITSNRVFIKTLIELLTIKKNSLLGRYRRSGQSTLVLLWRFAGVGIIGTLLDFTVLNVLHLSFGVDLKWALTVGFLAGATNNYLLNSLWTFDQGLAWTRFWRFLAVSVVGLTINNWLVLTAVDTFDWSYNASKIAAVFIVFFWNFLANRRWTFN